MGLVQSSFRQISLDTSRMGRLHTTFRVDQDKVSAVLDLWMALSPGVTYTQGLNEVAALLLYKFRDDVSEAAEALERLTSKDILGGLWLWEMPLYEAGRSKLDEIARCLVPALHKRFQEVGLDDSAYLPQAWHCLFSKWLAPELAVVALEDAMEHGMAAVLAITLAIFEEIERDVLEVTERSRDLESLLGPGGYFSNLLTLRLKCSKNGRLQSRWQEILACPNLLEAQWEQVVERRHSLCTAPCLTGSVALYVRYEARHIADLRALRRHNDKIAQAVLNVDAFRDQATREEAADLGEQRYVFKVVAVGDAAVGKSCLVHEGCASRRGRGLHKPTVGIDLLSKVLVVQGERIKLQIWDTAGAESFHSITRSYYRDMAVALLVYDLTCRESFSSVGEWLGEIRSQACNANLVIVLVGNKLDLEAQREVPHDEGQSFAASQGLLFVECSALSGKNVEQPFFLGAEAVLGLVRSSAPQESLDGVRVNTNFPDTQHSISLHEQRLSGTCRRLFAHGCEV